MGEICIAQVALRSGPSDQFPDTGTLQTGMQVWVDHEEDNGWLAVLDPPQTLRSISWIPMQFINVDKQRPFPQYVVVDEGGAPLRAGKIGLEEPLPVQRTRVPGGTILLVIGPPVQREGRTWYPVASPPGDFRYLPKQAVRPVVSNTFTYRVREPNLPGSNATDTANDTSRGSLPGSAFGSATSPSSSAANSAPPVGINHPLWQQAEAAELAGRYDEAERLYFELARLMNEGGKNHDLANLCYTRIHTLREKRRSLNGSPSAIPSGGWHNNTGSPSQRSPAPGGTSRTGQIGSSTTNEIEGGTPRWHGPGRLVRSAIALDGRKTYALESNPGVPIAYVVPDIGIDLERYVNATVRIQGPLQHRRGLSYPYITALAVEPSGR
ncbi:MAG: hypothetical protein NZ703_09850 [Gemmataceae bacterium]|nr:hypothetical protein [Gemmataceae bacterium]